MIKRIVIMTLAAGFGGCSAPDPVTLPEFVTSGAEGNVVVFTVSEPTLGVVRYGFSPGEYEVAAYPAAAQRRDKFFRTEHRIPLLSPAEGDTVYYQMMIETEDNRKQTSEEMMLVVGDFPPSPPLLTWTMINVGWGDSHFLTMPNTGTRILIDGGERRDWANVSRYFRNQGIDQLDYVIGTHIHADHIGGLVGEDGVSGVLGTYDIGMYLDSPTKSASRFAYDQLLDILATRSIPVDTLWAGDTDATRSVLAWDPDVRVQVLHSGKHGDGNLNNDSIVIRLSYGDVDLLTGGDAEQPVESQMVGNLGTGLDGEVLKVHHHGLGDASSPSFLEAVNARVGMIPLAAYEFSDADPYGGVAAELTARHTDVYASDRARILGVQPDPGRGFEITVATDGRSYEMRVARSASTLFPSGSFSVNVDIEPEGDEAP